METTGFKVHVNRPLPDRENSLDKTYRSDVHEGSIAVEVQGRTIRVPSLGDLQLESSYRQQLGKTHAEPTGIIDLTADELNELKSQIETHKLALHDSDPSFIIEELAGPRFDRKTKKFSYMENGKELQPLPGTANFPCYRLNTGLLMVLQPTNSSCHLCARMMLFDYHRLATPENLLPEYVYRSNSRESWDDVKEDVQEKAREGKRSVFLIEQGFPNNADGEKAMLETLRQALDKYGPCIIEKDGHLLIFDRITKIGNAYEVELREPRHGTQLKVVGSVHCVFSPFEETDLFNDRDDSDDETGGNESFGQNADNGCDRSTTNNDEFALFNLKAMFIK